MFENYTSIIKTALTAAACFDSMPSHWSFKATLMFDPQQKKERE